jgi:phosphoglycerol transferase MdoB-like AlkP superfamily enzyme
MFKNLLSRLKPYIILFLLVQYVVRITLLVRGAIEVPLSFTEILQSLAVGFWFDVVTCSLFVLPVVFYHLVLPAKKQGGKGDILADSILRGVFCYVLLFTAVAEHLFWTEFTARFNFIAVDYLVYTQEVIGNIVESYPIFWLLAAIAVHALLMVYVSRRLMPLRVEPVAIKRRFVQVFGAIAVALALYLVSSHEQSHIGENTVASEVAGNGIYQLFYAFWHNEISYDRFYITQDVQKVHTRINTLLDEPYISRTEHLGKQDVRVVNSGKPEQHKNVMLVVIESMSGNYMKAFGNTDNITPNLDRIAQEGWFFTDLYATGTRTVRGLEAVTLSIPPTPGQSIIRRSGNDNLFSLGFIFKDRGYDTRFIYGGYGYFDNMNAFFEVNGFDIVDRNNMSKEEVQFANVWGVCDEDMFERAIKEADDSYAKGKPFLNLIMTTSNHRPYTYPENRIDIPPPGGRLGGVKYTDYSIGKLLEWSKTKPWFKDTVFVFVADHTAGAGGKVELDPIKYHIPMIFYAPDLIKPKRYESISSQIDLAPTLLGLLNFSYPTKFYGEDLMHDANETQRSFVSNFQKVGMVKNGVLTLLSPKQQVKQYSWPESKLLESPQPELIDDTIAYYQSASWWREQQKRIPTDAK